MRRLGATNDRKANTDRIRGGEPVTYRAISRVDALSAIGVDMTSPNRQVFELKALHPRAWKQLSDAQKRLWCELVSAGVPIEKGFKEIKCLGANQNITKPSSQTQPTPNGNGR